MPPTPNETYAGDESFDQKSNPFGAQVSMDTDKMKKSSDTRFAFMKLMIYQQTERNLRFKHVHLMKQLSSIKKPTADLMVPLLQKIGELAGLLKMLVYNGKQEFMDKCMFSDNEDVKDQFNDEFFRQMMGVTMNRANECEVFMDLLGKFLNTRNYCFADGDGDVENKEDRAVYAVEWLDCLKRKYPDWGSLSVCNSENPRLWAKDVTPNTGEGSVLWTMPEPPPIKDGDFIHPILYKALAEDMFATESDLVNICCDSKYYNFASRYALYNDQVPKY